MSTEERLSRLENAFVTLTRLAESLDERLNTQLSWINELGAAQANSEARIAALADAQIHTEGRMARVETALASLAEAQTRTENALAKLAEAQSHTDQRLDALIDVVRGLRDSKP